MSAPAQKGVGGGRAAPLPAPRHHRRVPAPQIPPPPPLPSWVRGPPGLCQAWEEEEEEEGPGLAAPQPAHAGPSPGRSRGCPPVPPGKRGAMGGGGGMPSSSRRGCFVCSRVFPRTFGIFQRRYPPPAATHPERGWDHPECRCPSPNGLRKGGRPHWMRHWGGPWPKGPVGTVGMLGDPWDTWVSVGSAGTP